MIVESRPGASDTMGAAALVSARPDGYTLTQLPISVFRMPLMNKTFGFGGPKGMDRKVIKILHDAFRKAMDDPKVIAMLEKFDQPAIYMSGEDYAKFAKKTMEDERPLIERLGLAVKN